MFVTSYSLTLLVGHLGRICEAEDVLEEGGGSQCIQSRRLDGMSAPRNGRALFIRRFPWQCTSCQLYPSTLLPRPKGETCVGYTGTYVLPRYGLQSGG